MKRTFYAHSIWSFKGWETCFRFLDELSSLAALLPTSFLADHENVPTPPHDGL